MMSRRTALGGLVAAGLTAGRGWAAAGSPAFLSAARAPDGQYRLHGIGARGELLFGIDLPARGHAAAAHPERAEAVAFARRPGTFALVVDCARGIVAADLSAPQGRHFYGHGAFSADGTRLYTTENAYAEARGIVGVWDAANGYARIGEFPSGGVGPHEILRLPGTDTLAVANGGIETHPDSGRAKLNLPFMQPNLTYLSAEGTALESVHPAETARANSIRHLAAASDGTVAMAMQWQGDPADAPALLALHRQGGALRPLAAPAAAHRALQGYAGSVAISGDAAEVAISSPRGGQVHRFSFAGAFLGALHRADICGLAPHGAGFLATDGGGGLQAFRQGAPVVLARHPLAWDNHAIALAL